MIQIAVGGMATTKMVDLIHEHGGGEFEVRTTSDVAGAREVAAGIADYYFGSCTTGGGGALAMAIAILGYSRCFTVSAPGKVATDYEIRAAVDNDKAAFGFSLDHVHVTVPLVLRAILAHRQGTDRRGQ